MLKTMVGASKKLEAELAIAGHPNAFPSTPKTTTTEWDLQQTFDYRTLLCTQVLKGNAAVWQSAVADITAEVSDVAGLLRNLAGVKRTVSPTTHATALLMPSQAFMKTVLEQNPDISNAELVAVMSQAAGVEEAIIEGREGVADELSTRILSASPLRGSLSPNPFAGHPLSETLRSSRRTPSLAILSANPFAGCRCILRHRLRPGIRYAPRLILNSEPEKSKASTHFHFMKIR